MKMITKDDLKKIDALREEKRELEDLLRSFDNNYVYSKIGIVAFYKDHTSEKISDENEYAEFFNDAFKDEVAQMTDSIKSKIEAKIKHIDVELDLYIK